jgi:hypothetical protein
MTLCVTVNKLSKMVHNLWHFIVPSDILMTVILLSVLWLNGMAPLRTERVNEVKKLRLKQLEPKFEYWREEMNSIIIMDFFGSLFSSGFKPGKLFLLYFFNIPSFSGVSIGRVPFCTVLLDRISWHPTKNKQCEVRHFSLFVYLHSFLYILPFCWVLFC